MNFLRTPSACPPNFSIPVDIRKPKGPVNIYGNTGPGNLQWDHWLFWPFSWTGPLLIWGLALRGHGLFQYRISTGPKIIFKYSGAGSWTISSFFWSFSYKKYGTRANLYYGTNIYFGWRFQRGRGKFLTKRVRGHALFCMVKSTGPREISPLVTAHFPVPYSHKYWPVPYKRSLRNLATKWCVVAAYPLSKQRDK